MKILNLLVVVLAMVVVSCKKDSTVEPTKEVVADNTQIVSLSIGNKYYVANSEFTGSVVYSWGTNEIDITGHNNYEQ